MPKSAWGEVRAALGATDTVHRVELKVMLDNRLRDIVEGLGLREDSARGCEVYYWDDADLTFRRHGLIIRSRLATVGRTELVTKLRASSPRRLPKVVARLPALAVELDALPHRTQWSASVKHAVNTVGDLEAPYSRDAFLGLLSPQQRIFLAKSTGRGRALRDALAGEILPRGPVSVLKLVGSLPRLPRFVVESWHFPDGRQLLELSVKCKPKQCERTVIALRKLFAASDIRPCRSQRMKTDISLRHLRWDSAARAQPIGA
ncbi:MAG TPA: hypothetical protein VFE65_00350 [Pseudonocardia sp.]|nr:hypothetical protein [Pseudonocardia sp.]